METIKNTVKEATSSKGQFEQGFLPPVSHQDPPGTEGDLPVGPIHDKLPTADGGWQPYKAAGKLEGKKALITGGDSGIGRAVAILYAMEGADSFIVYLPEEEEDAQETKRRVEQFGRTCHLFSTDLRRPENCQKAVEAALQAMGRVNILVNNAAFQMMQMDITDIPIEQWHKTFDTNIHPYFYLAKFLIPHMKRGDAIINDASINAYIGRPDLLDYTSSKGGKFSSSFPIVSFTRGLANQQMSKGIRVNAVCPGPVWTPLIPSTMNDDAQKQFTSPMGRPAQPSEIATCFVFLASADSSMISGQSLHPNGGVIVNG
ncbi:oxidoreductase [Cladophialophora psammophila CBS 110553]|uniref:Oxidoreductase n=1 Tax=Cladophialophora psammophila CBS 110553 TaxID=1182543 RepID=W9WW22_9EURO|nr:oxidoreductase [Cladophialophora psammophila CBS 110553]EXJ69265.1 oxidoreductase [Cladophialophora psammophila CBS 110553]